MKTVFLDRDGVINEKRANGQYVTCWDEFEFLPGAISAVRLLNEAGLRVIVVTNQRGVALGVITEEALLDIHERMVKKMSAAGAKFDAIYYCPHDRGTCDCRKPEVGLFLRAKSHFPDIVFAESFVIGDSDPDLDSGRRLGMRLVRIGGTTSRDEFGARSLLDAVRRRVLPNAMGDARADQERSNPA